MQCGCSPTMLSVRVGSGVDQRADRERPKCRGCEVQRRGADVQLVWDFLDETILGDSRSREFRRRADKRHCLHFVGDDR